MTMGDSIEMLWVWTPFLAGGFVWNVLVTLVSMAIGTLLGFVLARMRLAGSHFGGVLTAATRLPPTFVLIFYFAYVLPPEMHVATYAISLPAWLKASLALAVAVTGFVSDTALSSLRHLRARERAEALYFIPAWTGYFLIIFMASSTASVIGVPEIVHRANTVIGATGEPSATLWVYGYVMVWFVAFCWPISQLLVLLRKRLARLASADRHRPDTNSVAGTRGEA